MSSWQDNAVFDIIEDSRNRNTKMTDSSSPTSCLSKTQGTATNEKEEGAGDEDEEDILLDMNPSSFEEQCGFVLHVMIVMLSMYYVSWILSFYSFLIPNMNGTISIDKNVKLQPLLLFLSSKHLNQPPLWTILLPITMIVLFFLIPIVYGACINRSVSVAMSNKNRKSLSTIQDSHTIRPLYVSPLLNMTSSSLYEDKDDFIKYYHDPMSWTPIQNEKSDNADIKFTTTVPDICDIDVADINNLLQLKYNINSPKEE